MLVPISESLDPQEKQDSIFWPALVWSRFKITTLVKRVFADWCKDSHPTFCYKTWTFQNVLRIFWTFFSPEVSHNLCISSQILLCMWKFMTRTSKIIEVQNIFKRKTSLVQFLCSLCSKNNWHQYVTAKTPPPLPKFPLLKGGGFSSKIPNFSAPAASFPLLWNFHVVPPSSKTFFRFC